MHGCGIEFGQTGERADREDLRYALTSVFSVFDGGRLRGRRGPVALVDILACQRSK